MPSLKHKIAIVTGASRGIGRAVALRFSAEGATVIINDLDEELLNDTASLIKTQGGLVSSIPGSVNNESTAQQLTDTALSTYGTLDIVVNCAGFTWDGMYHKITLEQWQAIIDTHLTGTFFITQNAFRTMRDIAKKESSGSSELLSRRIITVASQSAFGNLGQANYAAAKAGIIGLTKTIAIEGAFLNILANTVAYGIMDTRLTRPKEQGEVFQDRIALGVPAAIRNKVIESIPLGRPGTVEEAAGPILFLASKDSSYVTGQVIEVNGGAHM